MRDELAGWDLLTWRLGFEDKGIVPLVGCQITVAGHVDFSNVLRIVQSVVDEREVLRLALTKEEFPTIRRLDYFDIHDCIHVLHNHLNPAQVALRTAANAFSMSNYRDDLPLWRMYVVYNEDETLLFPFLHHAIADGRTALELVLRLCGETTPKQPLSGLTNGNIFDNIVGDVFENPLSLVAKIAPTLLNLGSLAALLPRHTLPNFSTRSFRDEIVQFSMPRDVMKVKANKLSVSIHDMSVGLTMRIIQTLEHYIEVTESTPIRINVPVAEQQSDSFNRLLIARLYVEGRDFEECSVNYRSRFLHWKQQPAVSFYSTALRAISKVPHIDLTSFATTSDTTVSSLPRVSVNLAFAGHEVLSLYPLVPSMGSAFNITSIGFNDSQYYTLSYDVGTKVDGVALRKAIREVLEKNFGIVPNFQQTA